MSTKSLVYWHHAMSLTHQKIAIASFLTQAAHYHATLYYSQHDAAVDAIQEAARAVEIRIFPVEAMPPAPTDIPADRWIWVGSHAPLDEGCKRLARLEPAPTAILCFDADAMGTLSAELPAGHRSFITGTPDVADIFKHS